MTVRLVRRSATSNMERRLPSETVTFHTLPAVDEVVTTQFEDKAVFSDDQDALRFRSGYADIDSALPLDDLITRLRDKKNLRLNVIGHADKQRLSIATKKTFCK